jgi:hypothetical protein
MTRFSKYILRILRSLVEVIFFKYPSKTKMLRQYFNSIPSSTVSDGLELKLCISLIPDRYFYVLLSLIRKNLCASRRCKVNFIVTPGHSSAFGDNFYSYLLRSMIGVIVRYRRWINLYKLENEAVYFINPRKFNLRAWLRDKSKAERIWKSSISSPQFNITIDGLDVTDLLIDTYLRFRPAASFDKHDKMVKSLIYRAIQSIDESQKLFDRGNIDIYIGTHSTYLEHGIPIKVALKRGIKVITVGNFTNFIKVLSVDDPFHNANCILYKTGFSQLSDADKADALKKAETHLVGRFNGNIDPATSYMRKSAHQSKFQDVTLELKDTKVVFLHDFFDSPHGHPAMIFQDFWTWACCTIETLSEANQSFLLKAHPNQINESQAVIDALNQKYKNLKWIPQDLPNSIIAKRGISMGITAYGTVAHELAYFGIPTVCCATHPHIAFDFCYTAKNIAEYKKFIIMDDKASLRTDDFKDQALQFYYMHNLDESSGDRIIRKYKTELYRYFSIEDRDERDCLQLISDISNHNELKNILSFKSLLLNEKKP